MRRSDGMTVCIAAICNIGPEKPVAVVTASDRMITIGDIEFEPDQTKLVKLATQTVALLAGDMQVHAAVIPRAIDRLSANPVGPLVKDIAEFYASEFAAYRRSLAERELLEPLGLTMDNWISKTS